MYCTADPTLAGCSSCFQPQYSNGNTPSRLLSSTEDFSYFSEYRGVLDSSNTRYHTDLLLEFLLHGPGHDYDEFYQDDYFGIDVVSSALHVTRSNYLANVLSNPCGFTLSVSVGTVTHDVSSGTTDVMSGLTASTNYTCSDGSSPSTTGFVTDLDKPIRSITLNQFYSADGVIDDNARLIIATDPVHVGSYTVPYLIGFNGQSETELTETGTYTLIITDVSAPCTPTFGASTSPLTLALDLFDASVYSESLSSEELNGCDNWEWEVSQDFPPGFPEIFTIDYEETDSIDLTFDQVTIAAAELGTYFIKVKQVQTGDSTNFAERDINVSIRNTCEEELYPLLPGPGTLTYQAGDPAQSWTTSDWNLRANIGYEGIVSQCEDELNRGNEFTFIVETGPTYATYSWDEITNQYTVYSDTLQPNGQPVGDSVLKVIKRQRFVNPSTGHNYSWFGTYTFYIAINDIDHCSSL